MSQRSAIKLKLYEQCHSPDCLVYVAMSGQSVLGIRGKNFLLGIMATAGIALRAIEYICVLSTVLTDIFSDEGIP